MYVRGCAFDCVDVRMCVDVRVRVRVCVLSYSYVCGAFTQVCACVGV